MLSSLVRSSHAGEQLLTSAARIFTTSALNSTATAAASSVKKSPLLKEFQIYRFDPEKDEKPSYKSYRVDINR
jgi:hypothetical protein